MEKRKRKKKPIYRCLIIITFLIITIVFVVYKYQNKKPQVYEIIGKIDVQHSDYGHETYGRGILIFEKGYLRLYQEEEIKLEIKKEELKKPEIINIKESIFLIDKELGNVEVLNAQGETIKKISIKEEIIDVKKDIHKNYLGFHVKELGDIEEIIFYDDQGEAIGRTGKIQNGKIIDYDFNKEEDKIAISAIEFKKNLENNLMIMNMRQRVESGKVFKNEMVLKTFIGKNKDIIYATADKLYAYGQDNKLKWEREIQIDKIDYSYSLDLIILCKEGLEKTQVMLIDRQNNILFEGMISGKIKKIISDDKGTILYGQRTIGLVYGNKVEEVKLNKDILWANKIDEKIIVIGNNKYIEIIKILSDKTL